MRSAEERNTPWQYQLGLLAVDLLVERGGADSIVEYFRQQHPQAVGADRRWQSRPNLAEAFRAAFGLELGEFYTEFEAWRDALPGRRVRDSGEPKLRGSLRDAFGEPATGFWINAAPYEGEHKAGRLRRAEVEQDGAFTLNLQPNTVQRLHFEQDGCSLWLTDEGLTSSRPQAGQYRDIRTSQLPKLDLTLPEGACSQDNELRVEVLALRGDDRRLEVGLSGESSWTWGRPSREGFAISPPTAGSYRMMVRIGESCDLWYGSGRLVASSEDAELIRVDGAVQLPELRYPYDLCVHRISGRLVNLSDDELIDVVISSRADRGVSGAAFHLSEGEFSLTVPTSGDYRLELIFDDCRVYHTPSGLTTDSRQATRVVVDDADVEGIVFRYRDLCN